MSADIDFPMPKSVVVDEASRKPGYAKFIAEPFMRGYGLTVGNALRRVLLSSMEGAAISELRIDGVQHEFAAAPNVKEDVAEIVLNLKCVHINMFADGPKTLEIRKDKAGEVTAADIITDGTVEILNPEQHICTLDKDKPFRAEITVIRGRGYRPAEKNDTRTIGTIPVDCLFSPVTRVNYHVSAARVGEETEMDGLELEIWTDGRIDPEDALKESARILCEHLNPFIGDSGEQGIELSDEDKALFSKLSRSIDSLELSVRSQNCLKSENIQIIGQLCRRTENHLLGCRNFGTKSLNEITAKLEELGLGLGMDYSKPLEDALAAEISKPQPVAEKKSKKQEK